MNLPIALEHALIRAWRGDAQRRARRRAMRRFARLHPRWFEQRFDDAFLARVPDGVLAAGAAESLAREWTRQFRYRDVRRHEREVRQLTPVAESFLALLRDAERDERRFRGAPRRADPPMPAEEILPAAR